MFKWNFSDIDSEQFAFQIIIDNNLSFNSIEYNSGEQNTSDQEWKFPNGTSYNNIGEGVWYWKIKTKDSDGDWNNFSEPWKVVIDSFKPISTIDVPDNNTFYKELDKISGTAYDVLGGTGLYNVEIQIERLSDNNYWSGNDWIQSEIWLNTTGKTNWSYNTSLIIWDNGHYKTISRAIDNASNIEDIGPGKHFFIDFEKPLSKIGNPKDGSFLNELNLIEGTSIDYNGSGIKKSEICIKDIDETRYWDGTEWISDITWLETVGTINWSFDSSNVKWESNHNYTIFSIAYDNLENNEDMNEGITYMFDNIQPTCSILINDGNIYSNKPEVILSLHSEDDGSGINKMTFSYDNSSWLSWENITSTKEIILTGTEGENNIFFKVNDRVGNTAEPVFDSIILDTKPPRDLSIIINNGEPETNSTNVTLTISAFDDTSGLDKISFSNDEIKWSEWDDYNNSFTYQLSSDEGIKYIYFKVRDNAGNVAESTLSSIILNTTQPTEDTDIDDDNEDSDKDPTEQDNNLRNQTKEKEGFKTQFILILFLIIIIIIVSLFFYLSKRKKTTSEQDKKEGILEETSGLHKEPQISTDKVIPQPEPVLQPIPVPTPQPIVEEVPTPKPIVQPEMPQLLEPTLEVQETMVPTEIDPEQLSTSKVTDLEITGKTKPVTPEVREQLGGKVLIIQKEE